MVAEIRRLCPSLLPSCHAGQCEKLGINGEVGDYGKRSDSALRYIAFTGSTVSGPAFVLRHVAVICTSRLPGSMTTMRFLAAFILPQLTFFTIRRPIAGVICLLLQVTLIGWLPATISAVYALANYETPNIPTVKLQKRYVRCAEAVPSRSWRAPTVFFSRYLAHTNQLQSDSAHMDFPVASTSPITL
jgi:uncharacterized membrane protein YqaE (UPF0057 family)